MTEMEVRAAITRCIKRLADSEPSKSAFARKVGATPQNVAQWTNGAKVPTLETLAHIADVYGLSMDALFGRDELPGGLTEDEAEVVGLMRTMNAHGGKMLVTVARAFKESGSYDS